MWSNLTQIYTLNNSMIMMILMNLLMMSILWITPLNMNLTPISMFLLLLIFSILTAFSCMWWMNLNWYTYLIILMMIGGLMISFMYMLSISPNEMKFSWILTNFLLMFSLIFIIMIINFYPQFNYLNFNFYELNTMNNLKFFISNHMYMYPLMLISMFIISYLFYCLIIVVKLINFFNKPMKSIYEK
uniref:NADH dehydrogenase subunit 6 n=1 Tax=Dendrocerus sp. ZJUH_2016009 TaxID=2491154 RepID=A0A3Q8UA03_9HYME|nr:NADH dehydrogenase subunit 6 [Dendrocerus sp. ZJUH_2016009]